MNKIKIFFIISLFIIGCKDNKKPLQEWVSLFDGTSTSGWRAYNGESMPPGWGIEDEFLTFRTEKILEQDYDYKGSRDIIYGAEEFDNFELYVEWKIPPGGNSGIFYHVKEGYPAPSVVAPEYQLIDDENYAKIHNLTSYNTQFGAVNPGDLQDWQKTAADYAMYTPNPAKKTLNPAGEWNSTKIVFTTEKVEHWLNGKMVLSFVPWSEDWNIKRNSGKWEGSPDYAKFKTGFIGFQDHGSDLWFRNIKIKKL